MKKKKTTIKKTQHTPAQLSSPSNNSRASSRNYIFTWQPLIDYIIKKLNEGGLNSHYRSKGAWANALKNRGSRDSKYIEDMLFALDDMTLTKILLFCWISQMSFECLDDVWLFRCWKDSEKIKKTNTHFWFFSENFIVTFKLH